MAFLAEFVEAGFHSAVEVGRHPNPRSANPHVEVIRVRAER